MGRRGPGRSRAPCTSAGRLGLARAVGGELRRGSPRVARAAVAVREDQQVDLASGRGPLRQHPARADLGVVGVREDPERPGRSSAWARRPAARGLTASERPPGPGGSGPASGPGTPVPPAGPRSLPARGTRGRRCPDGTTACRRRTRQEQRRGDRAAVALADVLDVGDLRVDQRAVVGVQRQLPGRLADGLARRAISSPRARRRCPSRR